MMSIFFHFSPPPPQFDQLLVEGGVSKKKKASTWCCNGGKLKIEAYYSFSPWRTTLLLLLLFELSWVESSLSSRGFSRVLAPRAPLLFVFRLIFHSNRASFSLTGLESRTNNRKGEEGGARRREKKVEPGVRQGKRDNWKIDPLFLCSSTDWG